MRVDVVEGVAGLSTNRKLYAEIAGIPITGYSIPFSIHLQLDLRPQAPELHLSDRTEYGFTVHWKEPKARACECDEKVDSSDCHNLSITHYALELATTSPAGTYYPFKELWKGAGHSPPTFDKGNVSQGSRRDLVKDRSMKGVVTEVYSYTLPVDTGLFGKLRLRCWVAGDIRPSAYSTEITLPRFMGKKDAADLQTIKKLEVMTRYYRAQKQHCTCGLPLAYRIGNTCSLNKWGGDPMPPPPLPTEKERQKGLIMPPVPYDVPRLADDIDGLQAAGEELASFYREMGVVGGGGGLLFGMRIDHVLHAIVGTPTKDGMSSPSRTAASISQPLAGLCEIALSDAVLPLLDKVAVAKAECAYTCEKLEGLMEQFVEHSDHYSSCLPHIRTMLFGMFNLYETLRHCGPTGEITFHLTNENYTKATKRTLMDELMARLKLLAWQLSISFLELQLDVGRHRMLAMAREKAARAKALVDGIAEARAAAQMRMIAVIRARLAVKRLLQRQHLRKSSISRSSLNRVDVIADGREFGDNDDISGVRIVNGDSQHGSKAGSQPRSDGVGNSLAAQLLDAGVHSNGTDRNMDESRIGDNVSTQNPLHGVSSFGPLGWVEFDDLEHRGSTGGIVPTPTKKESHRKNSDSLTPPPRLRANESTARIHRLLGQSLSEPHLQPDWWTAWWTAEPPRMHPRVAAGRALSQPASGYINRRDVDSRAVRVHPSSAGTSARLDWRQGSWSSPTRVRPSSATLVPFRTPNSHHPRKDRYERSRPHRVRHGEQVPQDILARLISARGSGLKSSTAILFTEGVSWS